MGSNADNSTKEIDALITNMPTEWRMPKNNPAIASDIREMEERQDQRQMSLWQHTMEVGRQAREETTEQKESPQEREHQRRQLSL